MLAIDQDPSLKLSIKRTEVDVSKPLKEQFNTNLKTCWESFISSWEEYGSDLDNELKKIASSYREIGIVDTKPYSPNPRKNRYQELNEWINIFKCSQYGSKKKASLFPMKIFVLRNYLKTIFIP